MKLIIGGTCQGKTAYLTEQMGVSEFHIMNGEDIAESHSVLTGGTVAVNHLHLYIRSALQNGRTQDEIQTEILFWLETNPELILVTDEIGYGIVPMDPFEREYREVTGRICCVLAQKAETVIRVCCGLGSVIKG
ncbi:MAG: bifunctional adenosylcobinamide kinase/adenosylcobinamide-phosphate guanylyltransferase [Lachnospiraceae bacterium]|nr:bifunctional adenosylcobinamide kinase/adenosylcobinamide-phosphate guanylyltransferase [Lachnospiraceae bacterium]